MANSIRMAIIGYGNNDNYNQYYFVTNKRAYYENIIGEVSSRFEEDGYIAIDVTNPNFIDSLEANTINGDIGCGNGKNMLHRTQDIKFIGVDICPLRAFEAIFLGSTLTLRGAHPHCSPPNAPR